MPALPGEAKFQRTVTLTQTLFPGVKVGAPPFPAGPAPSGFLLSSPDTDTLGCHVLEPRRPSPTRSSLTARPRALEGAHWGSRSFLPTPHTRSEWTREPFKHILKNGKH